MISGHGTIADAVEATRAGAFDFLEKPLSRDRVLLAVKHAMEHSTLQQENERLRELVGTSPKMIGTSPGLAARGGTGVDGGAQRCARAADRRIGHGQGTAGGAHSQCESVLGGPVREGELRGHPDRADGDANCSGTRRARSPAPRRCAAASSNWPTAARFFWMKSATCTAASQAKLLRVLQEGEFHRVGGEQIIRVSVRVVSATNRDLGAMVAAGEVPRGSVLPAERGADPRAGAARAAARYPPDGGVFPGGFLRAQ